MCVRTLTTFTNMSKQTTKTDLTCVCVRTLTTFTNMSKQTTKTDLTLMHIIDFGEDIRKASKFEAEHSFAIRVWEKM